MLFTLWVLSFVCLEKTRCFVSSNLASVQILKNVHTFLQKKSILAHAFDIDINQRGKSNQSKNQIQEQFHFVLLLKVLWQSEYRQIFCCKYKICNERNNAKMIQQSVGFDNSISIYSGYPSGTNWIR